MFKFWKKKPETTVGPKSSELADPQDSDAAAVVDSGWRQRLRASTLGRNLNALFSANPKLDEHLLDALETALLSADVGVSATEFLIEKLRKGIQARDYSDPTALLEHLRREMTGILRPLEQPLVLPDAPKPFVILVVGINGVGKTTTIGKLAKWMKQEGLNVMLAAGDTFRAAAVAQLKTWGERNDVTVIAQENNADSASVIFDALQAARSRAADVLIADTAGRLHTQSGLMDELTKIKRVLGKIDTGAPQETLLVIDGNTGQNAVSQVRMFHQTIGLTGLVVTKLDGTAKGGVVFALAREFKLPIRFIGMGEGIFDLRVFEAETFVDGVLPETLLPP